MNKNMKWAILFGGLGATAILTAAYVGTAQKYSTVFFPNVQFNGRDAAGLTVDQAKESIAENAKNYVMTIQARTGDEAIAGDEIGLHAEFDGTLEQLLANQNKYAWGLHIGKKQNYQIETMMVYEDDLLNDAILKLECMKKDSMQAPVDARISEYIEGKGYEIIPETEGTMLDAQMVTASIEEGITSLTPVLSLDEVGAYQQPEIRSDTPSLTEELENLNRYAAMTVIYRFGEQKEYLEGPVLQSWLAADAAGAMTVDDEKVKEYVKQLASKYDTAYCPKVLKTTYGPEVTITKGDYGWRINQKAEVDALKEIILSGQGQEREPVYLQTAASREEKDFGNTYVEINLTAQHLFYYVDGNLVIESDLVSGNEARGHSTPEGAYQVTYKQKNAVLRGQGYASPVKYWMPFNRGIGLHDANWRGTFGGQIYKTGGSHGCINLPTNTARTIFESIQKGDPVLCYRLDGTQSAGTTRGSDYKYGGTGSAGNQVAVAEQAPAAVNQTKPAETPAVAASSQNAAETAAADNSQNTAEPSSAAGSMNPAQTGVIADNHNTIEAGAVSSNQNTVEAGNTQSSKNVIEAETGASSQRGPGVTNPAPVSPEAASAAPAPVSPEAASAAPAPVPQGPGV